MTVGDLDALDRLADAYDTQVHQVRSLLEEYGREVWQSMPNYRDSAVDSMVRALVPRVRAGQLQTAELTRAYIAACARELGYKLNIPAVDSSFVSGSRGVPAEVVYQRPATTVYTSLAQGDTLDKAAKSGGVRLMDLIGGDLQMAKRNQSQRSMRASGVKQYRRILTGRENCALCTIAATQRYWVEDLLPIHPGCDCSTGPLPDGVDWGQVIDPHALEAAHDAVSQHLGTSDRGGRTPDYRHVLLSSDGGNLTVSGTRLVQVKQHGEYGPVLTWGTQHFTGPRGL